jgi:hypothetical protein
MKCSLRYEEAGIKPKIISMNKMIKTHRKPCGVKLLSKVLQAGTAENHAL